MKTDLFDYELPEELIATHPPERRDGGRLMVLDPVSGEISHSEISRLPKLLPPSCVIVSNNSRVIPARLRGRRPTGGAVEVLLVRHLEGTNKSTRWEALASANKTVKVGDTVLLGREVEARVTSKGDRGSVELSVNTSELMFRDHVKEVGDIPLPPYIKRETERADHLRYQTVYARHDGSVAAPTAGLHFTRELIGRLRQVGHDIEYLTLHVGPGTFRPIVAEDLADHGMDAEHYCIDGNTAENISVARRKGRSVVAVGTTSVRALEGSFRERGRLEESEGATDIFISPPYDFGIVDGLITNFHLPRSTLICLVSALAGRELVLKAYEEAVRKRYRFYSYGDAMLILPWKRS